MFLACGVGGGAVEAVLRRSRQIRVVDSPRSATVLVVAGRIPGSLDEALDRVHDQLGRPRATVWWTGGAPGDVGLRWPEATVVGGDGDVVAAAITVHRDLLLGARASDPPRSPDVEPNEWRGVGPYGQGGKAMTGGVPYGRPMAGRGDDRDGLSLDVVPIRVGPFFPVFPPGLVLQVVFAGDVVTSAEVQAWRPDDGGVGEAVPDDATTPFAAAAAGRPVAVADLEMARARHHLRWLARLLHLYGLDGLGRRALALAAGGATPSAVAALARRLDRPWSLGRQTAGVGAVTGDGAAAWGGPVARAAGIADDARSRSSTYAALDFEPVTFASGDVRDRWRQRLGEVAQALDLAARSGGAVVEPGETVERPAPALTDETATALGAVLRGLEWGDAAATIASLDLCLDAPAKAPAPAPAPA